MIKAIETRYAGCRFRSRLEARWAVFFDALGVAWEYEPQGFETAAGRYLPDFYLPTSKTWVEIKGAPATEADLARMAPVAFQLMMERGDRFRVLEGDLPRPGHRLMVQVGRQPARSRPAVLGLLRDFPQQGAVWLRTAWASSTWTAERFDAALEAARSARFEHGQTPDTTRPATPATSPAAPPKGLFDPKDFEIPTARERRRRKKESDEALTTFAKLLGGQRGF